MAEGGPKVLISSHKTGSGDVTYSMLNVDSDIFIYFEVS